MHHSSLIPEAQQEFNTFNYNSACHKYLEIFGQVIYAHKIRVNSLETVVPPSLVVLCQHLMSTSRRSILVATAKLTKYLGGADAIGRFLSASDLGP